MLWLRQGAAVGETERYTPGCLPAQKFPGADGRGLVGSRSKVHADEILAILGIVEGLPIRISDAGIAGKEHRPKPYGLSGRSVEDVSTFLLMPPHDGIIRGAPCARGVGCASKVRAQLLRGITTVQVIRRPAGESGVAAAHNRTHPTVSRIRDLQSRG